jgi:hypothetical protein
MMSSLALQKSQRVIGRYAIFDEIAAGGMATVHLGRLIGSEGFTRTVAIKRLHANYAKDPDFVAMFLDEARLAARIQHPNVVPTLDVVSLEGELYLIMEYVQGESFARLHRQLAAKGERVPLRITLSIFEGVLHGLHAAHEARSERGEPLGIVHRDVSPQNIQVGTDGVARVLDFGVAKAAWRQHTTKEGQLKGKLAYMAPEQFDIVPIDRRADIYAAAVVLWEALTGTRLFEAESPMVLISQITSKPIAKPSTLVRGLPPALDDIVMRGLSRKRDDRYPTAREMAIALENVGAASQREVGEWVELTVGEALHKRARKVAEIEGVSTIIARPSVRMAIGVDASMTRPPEPTAMTPTITPMHATPYPERAPHRGAWRSATVVAALIAASVATFAIALSLRAPVRAVRAESFAGEIMSLAYAAAANAAANESRAAIAAATSASAVAVPEASAKPAPPPRVATPRPRAAPPALPRQKSDCSPPYTVDANGIRRPKVQCL